MGRFAGHRPDWKKAIVTLQKGHKIDLDQIKERFGDDGPSTARSKQAGECYEKVGENYREITHH